MARTRDQMVARLTELHDEMAAIEKYPTPTQAQALRFDAARTEFDDIDRQRRSLDLERIASAGRGDSGLRIESGTPGTGDPYDNSAAGEARRIIDQAARSTGLPDHAGQRATELVEHGATVRDRSTAASWVRAVGDPSYLTAFSKLISNERGYLLWDDRERESFQTVEQFLARCRSMIPPAGTWSRSAWTPAS